MMATRFSCSGVGRVIPIAIMMARVMAMRMRIGSWTYSHYMI